MVKKLMYKGKEVPGYYIFDDGRIWTTKKKHKFLKTKIDKSGYYKANIVLSKNVQAQIGIHLLVAYTFLGMPPKDMKDSTVDHIDNDKTFNRYFNLQWLERSENSKKRINLAYNQRFTRQKIKEICTDIVNGMTYENVMQKYNIDKSYICNLTACRIHKDITTHYFPTFITERKEYTDIKSKIHDICKDLSSGLYTRKEISDKYGMTYLSVQNILLRKTYTDISILYNIDNVKPSLRSGRPKKQK